MAGSMVKTGNDILDIELLLKHEEKLALTLTAAQKAGRQ